MRLRNWNKVDIRQIENIKLDLGCGPHKKERHIGLDIDDCGQEIIWDLEKGIPLPDNSVMELRAFHILEHIRSENFIFVLREIYRVCKPGATFTAEVPIGVCDDPTHQTFFTPTSFEHWCIPLEKKTGWRQDYYGKNIKFREVSKIVFPTPQMVMRIELEVIK